MNSAMRTRDSDRACSRAHNSLWAAESMNCCIRQPEASPGDWEGVVQRVRHDLEEWVQEVRLASAP
jgi:hypothetical protein